MREETHELLESKITLHDKHRFEVKLDVELAPGRKNVYRVETYFFVPRALNVTRASYTKSRFYNSAQGYLRFKTPQMSLARLADAANLLSPLHGVHRKLIPILAGRHDSAGEHAVIDELKLLGAVAQGATRDFVRLLLRDLAEARQSRPGAARLARLQQSALAFLGEVKGFVAAMQFLNGQVAGPAVPARLRDAFHFCDEYLSIKLENYLTTLLEGVRESAQAREALAALDAELVLLIRQQRAHRRGMGYPSLIKSRGPNELMVYRRGVLKKFVSSGLFLEVQVSEWEGLVQFFYGLAAGAAMLFATIVALAAQSRYATNSLPFLSCVVIGYVFKDRIKDWLKLLFSRSMTLWLSDRRADIFDPGTGKRIGSFKEAFSFVPPEQVPPEIHRRRNADNFTTMDQEGKPERVMKYEKEVTLDPKPILACHERRKDLNDIMRFSIDAFLRQADDPKVDYLNLSDESDRLEALHCARVYHVNMIMRYAAQDSAGRPQLSYSRVRIVFTRDGIVRLEEVPVG
jgi:hypothetical protein